MEKRASPRQTPGRMHGEDAHINEMSAPDIHWSDTGNEVYWRCPPVDSSKTLISTPISDKYTSFTDDQPRIGECW